MDKICSNKEIPMHLKCALKLRNLTYKVAVDNC